MSRTLAIGDIHGWREPLDRLLDAVQPAAGDTVITVGDYVDRGPDSRGVFERMLELAGETQLIPLLGNHELMMAGAWREGVTPESWLEFGGRKTMESYGRKGKLGTLEDVPEAHWDFIMARCLWYFETETHIFVHASVDPELPLPDQSPDWLFWEPLRPALARPHMSGKTVICGHTSQKSGRPLNLGHTICIDTCVYGEQGWLSCLDVDSGHLWQTNQLGQFRESTIEEYLVDPDADDIGMGG